LRVAARKMRSVLRVFGRILGRDRTRELTKELRWLGARLPPRPGTSRSSTSAATPPRPVCHPNCWSARVQGPLTRFFGPAQATARREVLRTLRGKRYLRLHDAIERLLAEPPLTAAARWPSGKELPRTSPGACARWRAGRATCAVAAPGPDRDEQTPTDAQGGQAAALTRWTWPGRSSANRPGAPASGAKALTRVLGEFQDSVVARPILRDLGMRAKLAGENGFNVRTALRPASSTRPIGRSGSWTGSATRGGQEVPAWQG
jgi:hypothetical protein